MAPVDVVLLELVVDWCGLTIGSLCLFCTSSESRSEATATVVDELAALEENEGDQELVNEPFFAAKGLQGEAERD